MGVVYDKTNKSPLAGLAWVFAAGLLASFFWSGGFNLLLVQVLNLLGMIPEDNSDPLWSWTMPLVRSVLRPDADIAQAVASSKDVHGVSSLVGIPLFEEAMPWFLISFMFEVFYASAVGLRSCSNFQDDLSSLAAGIISQAAGAVIMSFTYLPYIWLHGYFHFESIASNNALTFLIALVGVDLGYYWQHRGAHNSAFLWNSHQVHHSSEYYNLAVALRQTAWSGLDSFFFYLPLAFFVPPEVLIVHRHYNLCYQFIIHTEVVGKLWWPIEYIFNTPSHHRVHHARNPYVFCEYGRGNFGGIFIIWDRMFGSFVLERDDEPNVYGAVPPLRHFYEPLYAQVAFWNTFWRRVFAAPNLAVALTYFFVSPRWVYNEDGGWTKTIIQPIGSQQNPPPRGVAPMTSSLRALCAAEGLVAAIAFFVMVSKADALKASLPTAVLVAALICWTLHTLGCLLEQRPDSLRTNATRNAALAVAAAILAVGGEDLWSWVFCKGGYGELSTHMAENKHNLTAVLWSATFAFGSLHFLSFGAELSSDVAADGAALVDGAAEELEAGEEAAEEEEEEEEEEPSTPEAPPSRKRARSTVRRRP